MIHSEKEQLEQINELYSKGIALFRERKIEEAYKLFSQIVSDYEEAVYYSVLEIQTRSKLYKNICEARLYPKKIDLKDDEDYLQDGIFQLNAGNLDTALERFTHLQKTKFNSGYVKYLISLVYLKQENQEECFNYLAQAIKEDSFYKVVAYNEPDFESYFDNESFLSMVA